MSQLPVSTYQHKPRCNNTPCDAPENESFGVHYSVSQHCPDVILESLQTIKPANSTAHSYSMYKSMEVKTILIDESHPVASSLQYVHVKIL